MFFALFGSPAAAQFARVESTGNKSFLLYRSDSLFVQGKYEEALTAVEEEIEQGIGDRSAKLYNRGLLSQLLGKGSGLGWFRQAYEADPNSFRAAWKLGEALTEAGQLTEGEVYLNEAVGKDKGYYESSVALGRNLRLQGRYKEAERAFDRTFGRDRTYVPAYIEAAKNQFDAGNTETALQILNTGYNKFPYEQILIELVRLHDQLGDSADVARFGSEYLSSYPKGPNLEEVLTSLRRTTPGQKWTAPTGYVSSLYEGGKPYASPELVMPTNRSLYYYVKWGPIVIGDLRVAALEGEYKGKPCWRARYIARSAPGLLFVSISDTFYAYLDRELRNTMYLEMRYHEQGYHAMKVYEADYEGGYYHARMLLGTGRWMIQMHPLPADVFDSTSQLWYAQQLVIAQRSGTCNVELSGGYERTIINYLGPDGDIDLSDGRTVPQYKIDGIMHYSGIAGLTGDFRGWYVRETAVWPAMAKFKIFLGWVTIKYKEHGPTEIPLGPHFDLDLLH